MFLKNIDKYIQIKIFQDEQTGLKWIETKRVILSKKHPPKAILRGCFLMGKEKQLNSKLSDRILQFLCFILTVYRMAFNLFCNLRNLGNLRGDILRSGRSLRHCL